MHAVGFQIYILKTNASKFTYGLDPLYGDACSTKSCEVSPLNFSTDRGPIDWLQSVLKFRRFANLFFFLFFLKTRRQFGGEGNWSSMVPM